MGPIGRGGRTKLSFSNWRKRASALLISLALVTVLTLLILAYLNVVTMNRMATRNYVQGAKAAEVGRGAIDFVLGQLRTEMARGTAPLDVGTYSVFTNVVSSNMTPELVGTNASMPTLVKLVTGNEGMFTNATATAVDAPTSTPSVNGRRVTTARWGRPGLGEPPTAPSWFLMGPGGVTNAPSEEVSGRFAFVIYDLGSLLDINVAGYPSSLSSEQREALAGTLAGLDVSAFGMSQPELDDLIEGFRNRASATTADTYTNHIINVAATNGFLRVSPGDDTFLGRLGFLEYVKLNNLTGAPEKFTTFTRTVTTPAWTPRENRGTVPVQTITRNNIPEYSPENGATTDTVTLNFNYKDKSGDASATNRSFLSQPVTGAFTRIDGTPAEVGEPLVRTRFPLSRLGWLSFEGPSDEAIDRFGSASAAAAKIKEAFGLVWDSGNRLWVYTSPTAANGGGSYASGNSNGPASSGKAASGVKTLAVVASENREPDFFELLQAGILKGSLGQHSSIVDPVTMPQPGEVTPEGHILQIGTNIIDQYDEDDFPTLVRAYMPSVMDWGHSVWNVEDSTGFVLGSGPNGRVLCDFAGIENIPYLMAFRPRAYRPQIGNSTDGGRRFGEAILMPQLWNPHQNANDPAADHPSAFRIIQTFGEIRMVFMGNKILSGVHTYRGYPTSPPSDWPSGTPGASQPMIEFSSARTFAQPGLLDPGDVISVSRPENVQQAFVQDQHTRADMNPNGFVGFWLGRAPAKGTEIVATNIVDQDSDNTPIDFDVWALFNNTTKDDCPVQQYITSVAFPVDFNAAALPSSAPFWKGDTAAAVMGKRDPVFELQYLDGSVWKTYQRFDGFARGGGGDHKWDTYHETPYQPEIARSFTSESHTAMYGHIDPRGSRFGLIHMADPHNLDGGSGDWNGNPHSYINSPFVDVIGSRGRPSGEASLLYRGNPFPGNQSGATFVTAFDPNNDSTQWDNYPVWQWANNVAAGQRMTGNDQVLRRADGETAAGANPLSTALTARPIILNRAFTSVGDLGYVFRDLPFKTLDLFSAESADAGLLDLFCVSEQPSVIAGRLNLNGRNAAVLAQALEGTVTEEVAGTTLSASEAEAIAEALVEETRTNAFTGLWDLPGFLASANYASAVNGELENVKTQMESVPRRLAAITDARCWNLLIDVVAQTGRYGEGVTDPNDFTVEGERRYWLQVAIDRFTGEIVDQQLEPVFE